MNRIWIGLGTVLLCMCSAVLRADWPQFRGPDGNGTAEQADLPLRWSEHENMVWSTELPGPGASSPIWIGEKIFVTCYSGVDRQDREADTSKLKLHVVCLRTTDGSILWTQGIQPAEKQPRGGRGGARWAGYASGTPCADETAVYVPFDNTGVFAFDHKGALLWKQDIGGGISGWGNASTAVLYENLVIVNGSQPSGSLIAMDKATGDIVWKSQEAEKTWSSPFLCKAGEEDLLVLAVKDGVKGFAPKTGQPLWMVEGMHDYVANTPVYHDGILYFAGRNTHEGSSTFALKLGETAAATPELLWAVQPGPPVCSPVVHDGRLYFQAGPVTWCLNASDGSTVYREQLEPRPRSNIYASLLLAGDSIYVVSHEDGVWVLPAGDAFKVEAHNVIDSDKSVFNASPAPLPGGRLLLRSDKAVYCIGE